MNEMNFDKLRAAVEISLKDERIQEMYNERKHKWVSKFQKNLLDNLKSAKNGYEWKTEYNLPEYSVNDRIDVCGLHDGYPKWIIEIDATRADQIAKKFVSRLALCGLKGSINYVAIMYPDTANGKAECEKYLRYCSVIIKKINPESAVYGIFIYPDKG